MLLQFSVENFMSFREKATFSLVPSADAALQGNKTTSGKNEALKTAVLYGANASGKSNLFKAFLTPVLMLLQSNDMQIDQALGFISPFKLDAVSRKKASSFEYIFVAGGTKYIYGFSATDRQIEEEYLYAYYSAKRSKIFERTGVCNFTFSRDKSRLEALTQRNTPNKLFLATATAWSYERTKEPYLCLSGNIGAFDSAFLLKNFSAYARDDTGTLKAFTKGLLSVADINICDFEVREEKLEREQADILARNHSGPKADRDITVQSPDKKYSLSTTHHVKESGKGETYSLEFGEESSGTQRLFLMAPHLREALARGGTIFADELGASIHPILAEEIVKMFHDPQVNRAGAQLIFTTHDVNLLNLDLFRRDQIYFTEKNPETAASVLYSLDEFPVRKRENAKKAYMQGRFGAIPLVGSRSALWE
jgi:AAA15 family ATPase/GTPase